MDEKRLPADLRRAVVFHGHLCPGLVIGWRAARAAAKALGVGKSEDEELVAIVENDSCSVDALQALLSTTFGKGNFIWRDLGKQAFTVIDRQKQRAVRVSFVGDSLRSKEPGGGRDAFMETLLTAPDDELLEIREAPAHLPPEARIEPTVTCARCKEAVQRSKLVARGKDLFCRDCAGEETQ